jgi:hypothetical protein
MTQFLSLRQVFEIFLGLAKFTPSTSLPDNHQLVEVLVVFSEALNYDTDFSATSSF